MLPVSGNLPNVSISPFFLFLPTLSNNDSNAHLKLNVYSYVFYIIEYSSLSILYYKANLHI